MAQVPHVKTCVAIYQQSAIPPIQYPVGRLPVTECLTMQVAGKAQPRDIDFVFDIISETIPAHL
jgi:hypothetical protein